MRTRLLLIAVFVLLVPTIAVTQQAAPGAGSQLTVKECEVTLIDEAKVPAKEAGQIEALEAFEGLEVEADTLLAQIDDLQAKSDQALAEAEAKAAHIEADSDAEIRVAKLTVVVAKAEWDQIVEANKIAPGAKSAAEERVKRYTFHKSEVQTDQAIINQHLAQAKAAAADVKVNASKINIDRRRVLAPFSGKVVQLYLHKGEWANPGDPVLHMVRLDRLRVVGWVEAADYGPADIAWRPVQLQVKLPGGRPANFQGKIVFVDPIVARGGKRFRIFAEVVNQKENDEWLLQPGLRGELAIDLTQRATPNESVRRGSRPGDARLADEPKPVEAETATAETEPTAPTLFKASASAIPDVAAPGKAIPASSREAAKAKSTPKPVKTPPGPMAVAPRKSTKASQPAAAASRVR